MKTFLAVVGLLFCISYTSAFSVGGETTDRRAFFTNTGATVAAAIGSIVASPQSSLAGPEIITTTSGIKYAVTKAPSDKKPVAPLKGDIVAIDYTGYLVNGQIFDATHSEGKSNALLFKVGSGSVIPGLDEMVSRMVVGQKVQAIIPPSLAYGDKGVCLTNEDGTQGECLIKPGSTLVYDILLKRSSIPPP
jgi:FKBP-type peptidyl-prolyl cis-trans isomerase